MDLGALLAQSELSGALGPTEQDHLLWARELQAISFAFHIPIVCFGVAFPAIVLYVHWLWLRTGEDHYKALAKRWSKVMAILFAVGVVTGTILSFELGLLWPDFMATFGDVFGLAFGLEGFSFFIEAIFIAIYIYGWDRLPRRAHFLTGFPIVVAGITGSLMVIAVNGWMNHPVGFDVADGRVTDVHPWEALFNPFFWHELTHMYVAAYMVAGFLVAGVYARAWMKGDRSRYVRAGLVVPLAVAALAAPVQLIVGDWAGREVARYQPTKLAALEGLGETTQGAAFHIGGYYDAADGEVKLGIPIPKLLSILAEHDPNATIRGLDAVPADDRPPVNVVRFAFQTMVGIGTLLAAFGVFTLVVAWRRRRLPAGRWFPPAVIAAGPLALTALICGWITTEVGRQPWVVYGHMRTAEAVTDAGGLPVAFLFLLLTYLTLLAAVVWLLRRLARRPPEVELATPGPRLPS
jgi:cytochrome d ubiquinol oxidase subunit I